jgi:UDP-N-acetylglucosamine 2-epimerase (non-hydrolysing)
VKLLHVVGARPNFPKLAPVHRAAGARNVAQVIVHTGQHYDDALSDQFFRDLAIPAPGHNLGVGSGSQAVQTARIMEAIEPVLLQERPDWTVVYGDVNSTMAATLVASKLGLRVAHVEAGLRSDDRTMPEEINRIVTDHLANLLLTPSRDADVRLAAEGIPASAVVFVGNVMVDSLLHALATRAATKPQANGHPTDAVIVTLHRPSNVDDPRRLQAIANALREIATERRVIFPAHPRTRQRLEQLAGGPSGLLGKVELVPPIPYLDMLELVKRSHAVVTDSGGVQEETTVLGVPCFTVRDNTERPITISEGTNQLVREPAQLPDLVRRARRPASERRPDGWDGRAAERVVDALLARA